MKNVCLEKDTHTVREAEGNVLFHKEDVFITQTPKVDICLIVKEVLYSFSDGLEGEKGYGLDINKIPNEGKGIAIEDGFNKRGLGLQAFRHILGIEAKSKNVENIFISKKENLEGLDI